MRMATVVLPVPGLPVKLMCRVGACEERPNFERTRSTRRSAAISRMRCLTGARPMSSSSSCSRTGPTPDCANSSARLIRPGGGARLGFGRLAHA